MFIKIIRQVCEFEQRDGNDQFAGSNRLYGVLNSRSGYVHS